MLGASEVITHLRSQFFVLLDLIVYHVTSSASTEYWHMVAATSRVENAKLKRQLEYVKSELHALTKRCSLAEDAKRKAEHRLNEQGCQKCYLQNALDMYWDFPLTVAQKVCFLERHRTFPQAPEPASEPSVPDSPKSASSTASLPLIDSHITQKPGAKDEAPSTPLRRAEQVQARPSPQKALAPLGRRTIEAKVLLNDLNKLEVPVKKAVSRTEISSDDISSWQSLGSDMDRSRTPDSHACELFYPSESMDAVNYANEVATPQPVQEVQKSQAARETVAASQQPGPAWVRSLQKNAATSPNGGSSKAPLMVVNKIRIGSKELGATLSDYYSDVRFQAYLEDEAFIAECVQAGFIDPAHVDKEVVAAIFAVRQYSQTDFKDINRVLWKYKERGCGFRKQNGKKCKENQ